MNTCIHTTNHRFKVSCLMIMIISNAERLWQKYEHDLDFMDHTLWMDETAFKRESVLNNYNSPLWAQYNPHVTHEWGYQAIQRINVWASTMAIVWLNHTYYPTASMGLLIECYCRKSTGAASGYATDSLT